LEFELRDQEERRVPADVVRVVDLDDGVGGRVAAYFRVATSGSPAKPLPAVSNSGGENDPGVSNGEL
jgi:hypothetical protein